MSVQKSVTSLIRVAAEHGYHPTRFIKMWDATPTISTLEKMVITGDIQTGFSKLAELGLLDYSVEKIVIDHSSNRSVIAAAKWRLDQVK
jgi:hypothetical protein